MRHNEIFFSGGPACDLQYYFSLVDGVEMIEVVYLDGPNIYVTNKEVRNGSGHVEGVRLLFKESVVELIDLVRLFIILFEPFSTYKLSENLPKYQRVGIYTFDDMDRDEILTFFNELEKLHHEEVNYWPRYIRAYCKGEEEFQEYLFKNPDVVCSIGVDKISRAYNVINCFDYGD